MRRLLNTLIGWATTFVLFFLAVALVAPGMVYSAPFSPHSNAVINGNWTFEQRTKFEQDWTLVNLAIGDFIVVGAPIAADSSTTLGIAVNDNVPSIVWLNDEVTPASISFLLPSNFRDNLSFRVLASESSDTTRSSIDWQVWRNRDGAIFGASAYAQAAVTVAACAATNEVVTLTPDATAEAALQAGDWVTLDIWNTTVGNGQLEVKGVAVYFRVYH